MNRIFIACLLALASIPAHSQRKLPKDELFYMLDENGKPTDREKKAKVFISVLKENDSTWRWDTYNIFGPMILSKQYSDRKGTIANGRCVYFNGRGTIDSMGTYKNGYKDGDWDIYNDTGRVVIERKYEMDNLVSTVDVLKRDSIEQLQNDKRTKIFTKAEVESEFPGKLKGWQMYLQKNLRYPPRAIDNEIQGKVVIQFIVNKDGKIESPQVYKSVEYSLDREALRMIEESPDWTPAVQDGKIVKSYKRQPVYFRLK